MTPSPGTTYTAPPPHASTGITGQPVSTRILSLDIFRGFTMAVMVFVNDLADIGGLPRWTHHIPRDVNAMSYVDMVYPFFLFAVGLSLPLALRQRLRRDPSQLRLWAHILLRVFALLVLGLILANAYSNSRALTHLRGSAWASLALTGAILVWAVYPPSTPRSLTHVLRGFGVALLVAMLALFRRQLPGGHVAWLDFSYPEILGLIGLTYLATCILYIPTRRFRWAPLAWLVVLVLLNIGITAGKLPYPQPMYLFPWDNGAMPSLTMAGIVISTLFLPDARPLSPFARPASPDLNAVSSQSPDPSSESTEVPQRAGKFLARTDRPMLLALLFALTCFVLGFFLRPLGISKIRATPTWALWSIAAATAVFTLFYWLLDRRHRIVWAAPFRAPGANTLLTYLLPDLTYFVLALLGFNRFLAHHWSYGLPGVVRAFLFTGLILLASYALTRAKLRLQL